MSPSLSWIEEAAWSELLVASGLSKPQPAREPAAPQPAAEPPPEPARGVAAERPAGPEEPLARLVLELLEETRAEAAFLADHLGLSLVEQGAGSGLVACSAPLLQALDHIDMLARWRPSGELVVGLENNRRLVFRSLESRWGRFAVGVVARDNFPTERLERMRRRILQELDSQGDVDA
ncbi:MAG: hypothetical protein U0002_07525 [Thermoanaerobaculia bacterium]